MDPEISKHSHELIFQTYNQLKSVLPKDLIKLKVLKSERYPVIKASILNEIQQEQNMLNKNPAKRFSAEKCLNHNWFKLLDKKGGEKAFGKKLQMKVINKMNDFVKENRFA